MDIVDGQLHFGPGGAAEVVAAMDALGIRSALIHEVWIKAGGGPVQQLQNGAFRTTSPTAELAAWTYPGRFAYVVHVDRRDPDLPAVVKLVRDARYAYALRILAGSNRTEASAFHAGEYDTVFAAAADCGLPIFAAISGHTEALAHYLKKFPQVNVIIDHCGTPPSRPIRELLAAMEGLPDSAEYWAKLGDRPLMESLASVTKLADYPNVAVKWAHSSAIFDAPRYPNEGARPYLRKLLNAFGAERVLWASDYTTLSTGETWAEVLFAMINNPELSASELEQVLGKTIRTWLNWSDVSAPLS
jgi:L-fuconolactonase